MPSAQRSVQHAVFLSIGVACAVLVLALNLRGSALLPHLKYYLSLPLLPAVDGAQDAARAWRGLVDRHLKAEETWREKQRLESELAALKLERQERERLRQENEQLRRLLDYRQRSKGRLALSYVRGPDTNIWRRGLRIDTGEAEGVGADTAVLADGWLVGRVVQCGREDSLVLLMTDPASAVAALTTRSRAAGVLCGQGSEALQFKYLPSDADVKVGDAVESSGLGGVYPKGYPLGVVERVGLSADKLTLQAEVRPGTRYDRLEAVFLLLEGKAAQ